MGWRAGCETDATTDGATAAAAAAVADLVAGSPNSANRLRAMIQSATPDLHGHLLDELAGAAAAGSPKALDVLLAFVVERNLTGPALRRLVSDRDLAEEIVQETLAAIAQSIHRFQGDARFTTWLYAVTRHVAIGHLRRRRSTDVVATDHHSTPAAGRRLSSIVSERHTVRTAIANLPPPFRDTVALRDLRGLSYAEIAQIQGIEINTVRSRLARGRALLASTCG